MIPKSTNPPVSDSDRPTRLIVGCGYVGLRVASLWLAAGDRVLAVTRSSQKAAELAKLGIEPIVWDWLDESWLSQPENSGPSQLDSVLVAVSHAPMPGTPPAQSHRLGLTHLERFLSKSQTARATRWVYLSTTGVFADPQGSPEPWVDESSPVGPSRPGSIAALEAERWLESSAIEHVILRPAGIYGPKRIPNVQPLREGQAMAVDPDSYLNLIHVDDLATVIAVVSQGSLSGRLYCVSDGHSVQRRDYYAFISQSMGWPPPNYVPCEGLLSTQLESSQLQPSQLQSSVPRRRSQGNKRVSNRRLVEEHSIRFAFPDYRSGLSSLFAEMAH
ncbi:MAG: SDR family oxidoreductase [Planctomycetota bacterium]|nr:SDR family oxidoreductase [Planctomycetota bacterium]